jgi:hypothetical protein
MFENQPYKHNILSYHGPLNIDFISFSANYIRDMIQADPRITKKIFKVFIELVQNVSYYSAQVRENEKKPDSRRGIGWYYIDELEDHYLLSTGNLISKSHGPILEKNCREINSLNESELRDLKRKTRSQADIKDIGAHIGLIHTGLMSDAPLDIKITPIDDEHSFFRIKVIIEKK